MRKNWTRESSVFTEQHDLCDMARAEFVSRLEEGNIITDVIQVLTKRSASEIAASIASLMDGKKGGLITFPHWHRQCALEAKLGAYQAVMASWANAVRGTNMTPTIIFGGHGEQNASMPGASTLVDLLTAKTAKDLALDLSFKPTARTTGTGGE